MINKILPTLILIFLIGCTSSIPNSKTENVHIYGNCDMCKKTIETAANVSGVSLADWDKDSKMASITFDSTKTNLDDVLKRIADVGYDSEKFTAPSSAYDNLHECCKYERARAK